VSFDAVTGQTNNSSAKPKALYRVPDTTQQTIKDFYIPDVSANKASFYTADKITGESTSMVRTIFYVKKGTEYEVMDTHFFNNEATSIQTKTI
jgi:hypothetical protein